MPRIRSASHAGSWYESDAAKLAGQIDGWLAKARAADGADALPPARAIIAPHAGYSYCGHVMAHAYARIRPHGIRRVFLLGPSHHVFTRKCALSGVRAYATPLGALTIDQATYAELAATGEFDTMAADVDEAEHSLELHLPYIAAVMRGHDFALVPIMVGALTPEAEARYGRLLAPYLADPATVFVVSSDFCHWGRRFNFTFVDAAAAAPDGAVWRSVEWLDRLGMALIEKGDADGFAAYLRRYRNTICGRHPIGVLLRMLEAHEPHGAAAFATAFTAYDQSSRAVGPSDSSVSYASAVVVDVAGGGGSGGGGQEAEEEEGNAVAAR